MLFRRAVRISGCFFSSVSTGHCDRMMNRTSHMARRISFDLELRLLTKSEINLRLLVFSTMKRTVTSADVDIICSRKDSINQLNQIMFITTTAKFVAEV